MANEVETRMGAMLTAIILGEDYPSELNMSRIENILQSIIDNTEYDDPIYSRIEFLLLELKKKMEENPTIEELTVTQNGEYHEEGKAYSPVIVDVDEGPTIESLSVTANGTYSEEGKAYTPVVVNVEGYKLEDMPTGTIATITDAAALPLNDLKVAIEPVQSGSGDPSPSNVRPISGWTECNLVDDSVNQWDEDWEVGNINDSGEPVSSSTTIRSKNFIVVKPSTSYYFVGTGALYVCQYDANKTFIRKDNLPNLTRQMTANTYYVKICTSGSYGNTYNNDISINYPSTDTSYHAFTGQTYNIEFKDGTNPLIVYGGTLDVTNGVLTVTDGYIASYNGETLPSTWISSMDVYAEGTTPTTRAEVVYELATPITYNLTPTEIKTLLGINNIFADTGDILEGEYFKEL